MQDYYVEKETALVLDLIIELGLPVKGGGDIREQFTHAAHTTPGVMRAMIQCALAEVQWDLIKGELS